MPRRRIGRIFLWTLCALYGAPPFVLRVGFADWPPCFPSREEDRDEPSSEPLVLSTALYGPHRPSVSRGAWCFPTGEDQEDRGTGRGPGCAASHAPAALSPLSS